MSLVQLIQSTFSIGTIGFNFLDIILLLVFIFYAIEGYSVGFFGALLDFLGFILSFVLGLKFYTFFGSLISNIYSMPAGFSNALGFFAASTLFEIIFNFLSRKISLPSSLTKGKVFASLGRFNEYFGILPGIASAFVLLSFLLTLIVSLPLSPFLKHAVSNSKIGSYLVSSSAGFEKNIQGVFGGAINETLNFLTVEPESNQLVNLKFRTSNVSPDAEAEQYMLQLLNKERTSRGLGALVFDTKLQEVARAHSKDMFERGYFSHYTPEGLSPFDRMEQANISYTYAGENLALAPNTDLAMQGLMQSPGHRANILSPNFKRVGLGVMDGGIYGEMFSQEFTD